jgi:hypothetical protein
MGKAESDWRSGIKHKDHQEKHEEHKVFKNSLVAQGQESACYNADARYWQLVRSSPMVMISVKAVYDGEEVRLLEKPPISGRYRVVVTFVEPEGEQEEDKDQLLYTFGAWQDHRSAEETIKFMRHELQEQNRLIYEVSP